MTTQLVAFNEVEKMAVAVAKSGLFGIKTPEQAIALMLIAQAEGLHPAVAARDYHVIQGRPALKSDAMLARFQAAGGKVVWNVYTDQEVTGTFNHPSGGSATISWTLNQAKNAGLCSKDVWRQYPRAMLRARVISEGIRTVYPGVSVGVYTPEEISDFDAKPPTKDVEAEVSVQRREVITVEADKSIDKAMAAQIIQSGKWTKPQLQNYCGFVFGVTSSKELSDDAFIQLALTVSGSDYETALSAVRDAQV